MPKNTVLYEQPLSLSHLPKGSKAAIMGRMNQQIISQEKYNQILCQLISFGHTFISIDSTLLFWLAKEGNEQFTQHLEKVVLSLFQQNVDIESSFLVIMGYLRSAWKINPSIMHKKCSSLILENVMMRIDRNSSTDVISAILSYVNSYSFEKYFDRWLQGHFFLPFNSVT